MKTVSKFKILGLILALLPGLLPSLSAAPADQTPPKELVQYVHEARRRGVAEIRIKQQAVAAGWLEATVDEAIASEKGGSKGPSSTPTAAVAAPPEVVARAAEPAPAPDTRMPATAPAAVIPPPNIAPGTGDEYLIGPGDTLQISVWKEVEASVPSVVVRPDGKITMPLIKDVAVAGLTPRQAEAAITERIGKYITAPNVTVVVAAINSKKIYLIGAVKKEGTLPYTYGMTVMQALSEAGGLTEYAKRKKIYILRSENGREYRLEFNYEEVIQGERMEQNAVLLAGDTVVVPQ
jgi:polysaccharide export outer membrane protein